MGNIFFVLAAVCFALGAVGVGGRVNWTDAGLCCVTIGVWLA